MSLKKSLFSFLLLFVISVSFIGSTFVDIVADATNNQAVKL